MQTAQALAEADHDARIRRRLDGKRPTRGAEAPKVEVPLRACAQAAFATAVRIGCRHPGDCVVAGFLEAVPDGGELDMSGMEMRRLGERWKLPTATWTSPASFATLRASWSLVGKSLSGRLPQRTA